MNQISLPPDELPKKWYNIIPDLPEPLPPSFISKLGDLARCIGLCGLRRL